MKIRYKGPLIKDLGLAGERKTDGIIPAHAGVWLLSRNRWLVLVSTLDPNGHDAVRSIVYQVRAETPDGPVLSEGFISKACDGWDPLERGGNWRKGCGMPVAFGVPKGACHQGQPLPHANCFVVKWYVRPFQPGGNCRQADPVVPPNYIRVEWLQCRLNDKEDDIEIIEPPSSLNQKGYDGTQFCALGKNLGMNHAMTPPVSSDASGRDWIECDTFYSPDQAALHHGGLAAVRYRYDDRTGRYEWVETGPILKLPDCAIGESSIVRNRNEWLLAFRIFRKEGGLGWCRFQNPFAPWPAAVIHPFAPEPRHLYMCADGIVRLLGNKSPAERHWRNPLFMWDVNPSTFELHNEKIICDAMAEKMPFYRAGLDMSKMTLPQKHRQWILFRAITVRQTAAIAVQDPPVTTAEHALAGIHYAEVEYEAR